MSSSAPPSSFDEDLQSLLLCFGLKECAVLGELGGVIGRAPEGIRHDVEEAVARASRSIPALVQAMEVSPIQPVGESLGQRRRSEATLIETLCQTSWEPVELRVPTSAIIGRALVVARLNFLKSLAYSLESTEDEEANRFAERLQELIDDAVFSRLAEELLSGTASNPLNTAEIRQRAARRLIHMWANLVHHPVSDFPTVLLSAWKARRKIETTYGTLFGTHEIFSLVRAQCEPAFVGFFTREQVTADEVEAFREFLFGIPHEELQLLQRHMKEKRLATLSRGEVYRITRKTLPEPAAGAPRAEEVFTAYWRRRIRAEYRALMARPGPTKTAEGYIMQFLLEHQEETPEG